MNEEWPKVNNGEISENEIKAQSSRRYAPSRVIKENIAREGYIFDEKNKIGTETKVCLIGDGQGADTRMFLSMGVDPKNIESINYAGEEVKYANGHYEEEVGLKGTGIEMKKGDATRMESLKELGIGEGSQDVVTLMHVLEVPDIKGEAEENLIRNISSILKPGGELLVTQYKTRLNADQARLVGVEEIEEDDLEKKFGDGWRERFKSEYGKEWYPGMPYSEISRIRSREELIQAFEKYFTVKIEENEDEYVLRMKKKEENADARDPVAKQLEDLLAANNGDKAAAIDSLIETIRPMLDLKIVGEVIDDKEAFIRQLSGCATEPDDTRFIENIKKIIAPLVMLKLNSSLELAREYEKTKAKKWGGEAINDVLYYGIDEAKKEIHLHVHTTKVSIAGKTVDVLGENSGSKAKSDWLYDQLTEGLIKLRMVAEQQKDKISTVTGDSELVFKLRNTLMKLGFKVELYEKEYTKDASGKNFGKKSKAGECSIGIDEFLSQEFLDRVMEFRRERHLG